MYLTHKSILLVNHIPLNMRLKKRQQPHFLVQFSGPILSLVTGENNYFSLQMLFNYFV